MGKKDTGGHLYVNPDKKIHGIRGWFNCFRCGARGPAARLLGEEVSRPRISKWNEFVRSLRGGISDDEDGEDLVFLPEDYEPVIPQTDAYQYLKERGLTDEQIDFYQIGFGTKNLRKVPKEERKRYIGKGRVVFPDFDTDGRMLFYWVARTYRSHKLKYKNPQANAFDKIYNLAKASVYNEVVVTEGVFSAIASGYNAVATYGKAVTKKQLRMLVDANFDRYTIALDGDAKKESLDLAEKLSRRGCEVALVEFLNNEDPASVDNIKERIADALEFTFSNKLIFAMGSL
jgi:DNA primase